MFKYGLAITGLLAMTVSTLAFSFSADAARKTTNGPAIVKTTIESPYPMLLSKREFLPGETIELKYWTLVPPPQNAWVGIIPAGIPHGKISLNDQHEVSYQSLISGSPSGVLTFTAPMQVGQYDMRLNSSDGKWGKELSYTTFKVTTSPSNVTADAGFNALGYEVDYSKQPALLIEHQSFRPGETMVVSYTASPPWIKNGWIGIVPSNVSHAGSISNSTVNIPYQYIEELTTGQVIFQAPRAPGSYDVRLFDSDKNGREVYSTTFTVH